MGMGFAPTWLRQVSPPASQNHFNHCTIRHCSALFKLLLYTSCVISSRIALGHLYCGSGRVRRLRTGQEMWTHVRLIKADDRISLTCTIVSTQYHHWTHVYRMLKNIVLCMLAHMLTRAVGPANCKSVGLFSRTQQVIFRTVRTMQQK